MKKLLKNICLTAAAAAVFASSFAFTACGEEHEHTEGDPVRENVVAASCTSAGSYDEVVYCTDCGDEISRTPKTIAKTPHTPSGEAIIENRVEASCAKEGGYDEVYMCADCGEEASRTHKKIGKLDHTYAETYSKDSTGHWYECSECGDKKDFAAHVPGAAATETTSQLCTVCNYVIATPLNHTHSLTPVQRVEAGCLTNGNVAYYTCSCGEWFADEEGAEKIDNHDDVVLKAVGHSYSEEWTPSETEHWHAASCEHSEEIADKAAHTFGAGKISGNKITYQCTVCKYSAVKDLYTVTYEYNYSGSPAAVTAKVEDGKNISTPENFRREGYALSGWYTDANCTAEYDVKTAVSGDIQLYAKWVEPQANVLEAEYTNLKGIKGVGYSSETTGTGLIQTDAGGAAKASNGYFVGYLYRYGTTLTFKFESSVEVYDAKIALRLSGEFVESLSLTSNEFVVKVNGEQLNYEKITISGIDPDTKKEEKREFQDFVVGTNVHLSAGENTVTLTVNNSKVMVANMRSTAPLVDCMKIYTGAEIAFDPILSNLDRFNN